VERRIEAGHLGQLGGALEQTTHRSQGGGLVKRGERNQRLELRQHGRIDAGRTGEFGTAVNHTMSDPGEAVVRQLGPQEREQMIEGAAVAEIGALGPGFLGLRPVALLRDEVG
jgi:hypothetical protein